MNPSNVALVCTLADRIADSMTGVEGICAGFKVRSDGSKAVCIAWNAHGDPRYLWVSENRVVAARTPEQVAADSERAQAEARRVMDAAGLGDAAATGAAANASTGAGASASTTEQPAPTSTRRRRATGAARDGGAHPGSLEQSERE